MTLVIWTEFGSLLEDECLSSYSNKQTYQCYHTESWGRDGVTRVGVCVGREGGG